MFRYTAERYVDQQPDAVIAYLADPSRQTEWVRGVSDCRWTDGASPTNGAVAEQTMVFMGKKRVVPMTMADYEPGRRVVYEKHNPFYVRFGFEAEPDKTGTRLRYPVEMQPRGLMRLVIGLMGRKAIRGDLERIAASLTSSPTG